jgi:hypothetical protein
MMHTVSFKLTVKLEITDAALVIATAKAMYPDFFAEPGMNSELDDALQLLLPDVNEDHPGIGDVREVAIEPAAWGGVDEPVS